MSTSLEEEKMESLKRLVQKLLEEHHGFSSQVHGLKQGIEDSATFDSISDSFLPLRDALIEHMLVEESEIFPEVSRRGLFDERISEIMQQHLDITASLDNMRRALHHKNLGELRLVFAKLDSVMNDHFPAEGRQVFALVL
ncbi:MAG: hypothetical protein ACREBQ_00290 [Nitrososphaerales archaeon]